MSLGLRLKGGRVINGFRLWYLVCVSFYSFFLFFSLSFFIVRIEADYGDSEDVVSYVLFFLFCVFFICVAGFFYLYLLDRVVVGEGDEVFKG